MAVRVLSLHELEQLDSDVMTRCEQLDSRFRADLPGSTRIAYRPMGDAPADLLRAIARAWALLGQAEQELEARHSGATCR